jgi:peptide/nickel transport system substrate-binding protein
MKIINNKLALALLTAGLSFAVNAADVTIAYDADPVSMDPQEQLSGATLQLNHLVFDPLVRFTQSKQFEPRLATRWERIDDKTMRFHLRHGVTFHTGNPFTADDVVWTFNRMKTSTDFKGIFNEIKKAVKVDDYTVDLVTKNPYPLILQNATYLFPMDHKFYSGKTADGKDKSEIIKHGNSFASTHESGTGPFIVTSREQGVKLTFKRFKDYWDKQSKGNVDHLTWVPIKEDATRVAALLSGDVDMIAPVAPNDLRRVESAKGIDLVTLPGTRVITLQMNEKKQPAFKDKRVREAVVYAINNAGIVKKIMRGFGTVTAQQSPAGYLGHNPDLKPRYNLKKAKALMKEAGYEKGFKITMIAPNNRYVNDAKIAQAAASMLSKIGIKVDLKTMPKAQYWPEFDKCAADMLMIGWHSDTEDSGNLTEYLTMTRNPDTGKGQYNCGYYSNPSVDKLVNQSNVETDPAKRSEMLKAIETKLYQDAAFVPLHFQNLAWGAKSTLDLKPVVNAMNYPYLGDLVVKE